MIKVSKLIEKLQQLPPDSYAYAYEGMPFTGESSGIVVVDRLNDDSFTLAFFEAADVSAEE